jgi:uncharacterized protein YuzE
MSESTISVSVDITADCAYIRLSDQPVVRSVSVTDAVVVDIDQYNMVVGIEVLELGAELPFQQLVDRFHVHSDVIEILRRVRPSVSGFLTLTQSSEAIRAGSVLRELDPR